MMTLGFCKRGNDRLEISEHPVLAQQNIDMETCPNAKLYEVRNLGPFQGHVTREWFWDRDDSASSCCLQHSMFWPRCMGDQGQVFLCPEME